MLHKITEYVSKLHMIEAGDRIVAGVSGGADSVCLFYMLLEFQKKIPFSFAAVHVHHGIRAEAESDAEYVRRLCAAHGVFFELVREDVPSYAAERHISVEEAGRELRYRAFDEVCRGLYGADGKIAVAHHCDDRAETVLFHLFRGSALKGLCSMEPVRGNVIRPLLCVTRKEIEQWLNEREIAYCTDATNGTDHYARNRIRHHILPYAEREVCPGAAAHIGRTADMLSEAADYLDAQTAEAYKACVKESGGSLFVAGEQFGKLHPYLKKSLVHACFARLTPQAKNVTSAHVLSVCGLFEKQAGRRVSLPYGICAKREYGGVLLKKQSGAEESGRSGGEGPQTVLLDLKKTAGTVFYGGMRFDFRIFDYDGKNGSFEEIPKNNFTKWFDCDKIKESVGFRYRQPHDFLVIGEGGGRKSVKKFMIDEKIPAEERESVVLLAEGSHILWAAGYRISEAYKISAQTKKVIEIRMTGGKYDG